MSTPASHPVRSRGDRGAGLVEYALLVALIAVVCFASVLFLGDTTSKKFSSSGQSIIDASS